MANKSPVPIHQRKCSSDQPSTVEEPHILEEFGQYYLQAYPQLVQLACYSFPELHDLNAKIQAKISHLGASKVRFHLLPSPSGIYVEFLPENGPAQKKGCSPLPYRNEGQISLGCYDFLSKFLFKALDSFVSEVSLEGLSTASIQSLEKSFLLQQLICHLAEEQRRWTQQLSELRESQREKQDREKSEIRKEEERKQERRLAIQKVEEPKRLLQRHIIEKEEADRAYVRAHRSKN